MIKQNQGISFQVIGQCPLCRQKGSSVGVQTVSIHVNDISTVQKDKEYWVCKNPLCECVYFGGTLVKNFDLNKEFGLKENSSPNAHLCYCFNVTKKSIDEHDIQAIETKMDQYGCQCVMRNITGKCCLNDIKKYLEREKS